MSDQADQRPRPQYGEYADSAHPASTTPPAEGTVPAAPEAPQSAHVPQQPANPAPLADRPSGKYGSALPGVPHNLGVGASDKSNAKFAGAEPQQAQTPQHGQPYRASEPANQAPQPVQFGAQGAPAQRPNRLADRIVTIVLLVMGAFGALQTALPLMTIGASLSDLAVNAFKLEDFTVSSSVTTLGTVGAIVILSLYALVLIFSVQRLRAGKLTFWAPLAAGFIAMVLAFVIYAIALAQSPELLQASMDPDAMQQMLDYAESQAL